MSTNDREETSWAIALAEKLFGYDFTKEQVESLSKDVEKKQKHQTPFIALMFAINNGNVNYKKPKLEKNMATINQYLVSKGIEADGATMSQVRIFQEYNLMRTNLKTSFTDPVSEATAKRYAEYSNKKPPDYASEVVQHVVIQASDEAMRALGLRFQSVTDKRLPNNKQGVIDYLDYKTRLFALDHQQFIETDYDYYRKLYAEKLRNARFGDNISMQQSIINEKAMKQAVNSANRVNRFNIMKNNELSRLEYINNQEGVKKGRGIYTARAAADEDCKAHQGVVMTYEQFISIAPVHVNCICTFEPIPDTMSDEKVLDNTMGDDGTIPGSADIYRKAGTSRYPKFENIGMRVENKYKFRYNEIGVNHRQAKAPESSMPKEIQLLLKEKQDKIRAIEKSIGTDAFPLKIKEGAQAKHDKNSSKYLDKKSFFKEGVDPLEMLLKYSGKGKVTLDSKLNWYGNFEYVETGEFVGYVYEKRTGKLIKTTKLKIAYSKNGAHLFPDNPWEKRYKFKGEKIWNLKTKK